MTRMEETQGLRARTDVHFNCCQSVLVPFAEVCGLDKDAAFRLGTSFGAGVRCGSACGALTGALMVLGLAGRDLAAGEELLRRFRAQNGPVDCAGRPAPPRPGGWVPGRWRSCRPFLKKPAGAPHWGGPPLCCGHICLWGAASLTRRPRPYCKVRVTGSSKTVAWDQLSSRVTLSQG